jgi:multicomponent K+:H+ antiporter subunit G
VNTCQPLHGSVFALIGATGLLRMKDVFQHMQPPALASTLGPDVLLARTALFRKRMAGDDVPAEVSSRR